MMLASFLTGFFLSAGLIVAIGAQNAFVLRQGLLREHVGAVVVFCTAADVVLMSAGVAGLGAALERVPGLLSVLALGGAAFLAWYGLAALRRAARPERLVAAKNGTGASLWGTLAKVAALTLLNPHVYLDTVLLVGSIGATQPEAGRAWFVAGAGLASALWFAALGYGARLLAPVFARETAWRVLDAVIGVTMLGIAVGLVGFVG